MSESATFEVVEFCEPALEPGQPFPGTSETVLGTFEDEVDAVKVGRTAWLAFRDAPTNDVMWWLVRKQGESMALWIADGHSGVERVLDLTTNELVPVV